MMTGRSRRDIPKTDKFAALRRAREGGGRDYKVNMNLDILHSVVLTLMSG